MTTPEARELLACPFCGSATAPAVINVPGEGPMVFCAQEEAGGCGVAMPAWTKTEAIRLWNHRAALSRSQPVLGLVEALEAIQSEAERTNGSWVHLKRVIGTKARDALATFRSAQGEG